MLLFHEQRLNFFLSKFQCLRAQFPLSLFWPFLIPSQLLHLGYDLVLS